MGENPGPVRDESGETKGRWLTIGEFARRSLLSPKALRLYDRLDVLAPAAVDPGTGYRRYRESQLETARLIARLRHLDMPLARVGEIVAMPEERRSDALIAYWDAVERRMAGQREVLMYLLIALAGKERNFDMFDVQVRNIPEQLMLTEQRYITVDALPDWMGSAFGRMWEMAPRFGGVTGPLLAIFHGQVNAESDGPVEICAPITAVQETAPDVPTRMEPAHQEAFTRLRKSQVAFPKILSAYDAVEQWIARNGMIASAPPREVYFADFMNAGLDEEVVDVAFPIEDANGRG